MFDDSLYAGTRGKGTEFVAGVFDHNDHKTRMGYRMMTRGWINGDTFIPFDYVLFDTWFSNPLQLIFLKLSKAPYRMS